MTDRELMQQAWDALESDCGATKFGASEALRARLAQPEQEYRDVVIAGDLWRVEFLPDNNANVRLVKANYTTKQEKQEPVAWMHDSHVGFNVPLYTAPPQREWQGLTDEEIKEIVGPWGSLPVDGYTRKLFDQIEAKLKEKNT